MNPIVVIAGPLAAASANSIVTTVTPTAGQVLTLTISPYVLDKPRQVLVTYGAEGTARTLTLTGTNLTGQSQFETITIPTSGASTIASVLDYATVTRIVSNSAFTNAITIGTNGIAGSAWVRLDTWANSYIAIQCTAAGTVNYTVQSTLDDPNSPTNPVLPVNVTWVATSDTAAVGATSTVQTNFGFCPLFARVLLNSGTGSVVTTFAQAGNVVR